MPVDNRGSAILPTFAFLSERSLGFYSSGSSTINVSYGTLSVSSLAVANGATITGSVGVGSLNAAAAINVDKSITAVGGTAHGILLNPTLIAGANNDIFAFMRVQPIVTPGGFTGTQGRLIWVRNPSGAPANLYGIYIDTLSGAAGDNMAIYTNTGRVRLGDTLMVQVGTALAPPYAYESELSLGWYRSGASVMALSYGQASLVSGSNTTPSLGWGSTLSLGLYSSGVQTIAQSLGTLNLATNAVRLSMRTLAASSLTPSAANTNVATNEVVFTVGGASGASFAISSGGTTYIFNSDASAKNT